MSGRGIYPRHARRQTAERKAWAIAVGVLVVIVCILIGQVRTARAELRAEQWGCEWHYQSLNGTGVCK